MGRLIINADDFGISENINKAIVHAFEEKLISSTTIMTNMPGYEEACELINSLYLYGKVGIHLNLTEGYPITERMSLCKKFCDENGKFKGERHTLFWLNSEERKAVQEEFQAQINKLTNKRIIPTHIDSHHHYHTEWAIGNEVIKIARKNGIKAIRLTRNCGKCISKVKRAYKIFYNLNLSAYGFSKVQYFGSVNDIITISKLALHDIEIMVHPGFDKEGELIDLTNGKKLLPLIENIKILLPDTRLSTY